MSRLGLFPGFVYLVIFSVVKGDYSCVCNYDEENQIYSEPDVQSQQLDTLYEFDCKPSYDGYTGNGFAAIQIGGKIGYVDSQTNIQLQTCSGDASPLDLSKATTTTVLPRAANTTQISTAATTKRIQTAVTKTQMHTVATTTKIPTTTTNGQISTAATTKQIPTAASKAQISTVATTKQIPTASTKTQISTAATTKQIPTVATTKQMPRIASTTQMPTDAITKHLPKAPSTTHIPTATITQIRTTITTTDISTVGTTAQVQTVLTSSQQPSTNAYHRTNVTNKALQYIGVSYDLTNGNPLLGTDTASMTDPGLLIGKQVFELNEYLNGTSREIEKTNLSIPCDTQYALIHNGKSYQEELFTLVRPTVAHPQRLLDSAFIFNKEFKKVRSFTENHQNTNVYQDELTVCSKQKLRLKVELADTETLSITRDFAKDACDLPEIYDANEYINFLDKWGTSIVTEVLLGSKQLQRQQTTEQAIFSLVNQKNPGLLRHSGSYMGYASSLTLSRQDYITNMARTSHLGSNVTTSTFTNHGELVPVRLKVVPITLAFDWTFWQHRMGEFHSGGVCRDDITISSIRLKAENLNRTLHQVIDIKNKIPGINTDPLTDAFLQMPVTWPKGTYGLMKPNTGCPAGHVTWHEGWRVQDSRNLGVHNHFTSGISNTLAGVFDNRELVTRFCMKTDSTISPYDRDWPSGNYCILKKNACPSGFSSGSIYWDDRDFINKNKHGGTLPDGTYDRNTKIYYCCRNDGSASNPITLPVDRAFVLIRYKGACQKVYNMDSREVFIQWDTANVANDDEDKGAHPLDDGGKEHKLHFCYYYFNTGGVFVG